MQNNAAIRKFAAIWLVICMVMPSLFTAVSADDSNTANVVTSESKLVFEGFTLQYGQDGTIQALVDVSIENIDATGVDFTLEYNSNYIVPSNFETNEAATVAADTFKANTEVFSDEAYLSKEYSEINDDGSITMSLAVDSQTPDSTYIGTKTFGSPASQSVKCVLASDNKVKLGQMSFQLKHSLSIFNMDQSTLDSILNISSDDDKESQIIYVGDDGYEYFVEAIPATWEIKLELSDVVAAVNKRTVSAYSIYNRCGDETQAGTKADLIAYLNQTMNTVILRYSNSNQVLSSIIWSSDDATFSIRDSDGNVLDDTNYTYNPLGGTYTVSQGYGGTDKTVTVTVTVTPVTITGFEYDNRIITYSDSARPSDWDALKMPDPVTPVMDGTDDMYVAPTENPIQNDWTPNDVTETLTSSPAPATETYTETFDSSLFVTLAWLTVPDGFNWNIDAIRNIAADDDPTLDSADISAYVDRTTGNLIITVTGVTFTDGTNFNVYLPNGTALSTADTSSGGNGDFVTAVLNGNSAVITVNALGEGITSKTSDELQYIQSIINLGSDAFSLSAVPTDGVETTPKTFSFAARENYYLPETDNYVEKDYSEGRAGMFSVYEGQSLSDIATYIAFPDKSTIPIAYDGQSGYESARYDCAKVESWSIEGSTDTVLPAEGTTVTLVGKLQDYSYTNFGYVTNPDTIYLKIKVTTLAAKATPEPTSTPEPTATPDPNATPDPDATPTPEPTATPDPSDIDDAIRITTDVGTADAPVEVTLNGKTFEYDTKKTGYDVSDVQKQTYTIENIGTENISGLTMRIADFVDDSGNTAADSSPSSYVNSVPLYVTVLNVADKAQFEIRTKHGLAAGTYTARVSIGSSSNDEIAYFNISFKVTDSDIYTVTVNNGDTVQQGIGLGYLTDSDGSTIYSKTYAAGDTVNIYVKMIDSGYSFDKWTSNDGITFADASSVSTTFTMPASNVTVTPTFRETNAVWVRLADLRDYNENETTANTLRNSTPPYSAIAFAETTYAYRVIVDGTVEKNYIEFDLKNTLLNATSPMTVTASANDTTVTLTAGTANDNTGITTYKSDLFSLNEGLNTVKIKTSYYDSNDDQTYTAEYTLTIVRKKAVDVTLNPGNSPYGIIDQSDNITDKAAAKAAFSANHIYDTSYMPDRAVNTYNTHYYTDVWGDTNYDENSYTLFVYPDKAFVDPGFKDLKDMDGNAVEASSVKRTIKVQTLDSVPVDMTTIQTVTDTTITVQNTGETCVISELMGYNIRPGAYTLEYAFTDTDDATRTFTRPLVVLAAKGDVNLDGSVDTSDADILYSRMTTDSNGNGFYNNILTSADEWTQIYAYRVADMTEDRNVNSIDANAALNGASTTPYYESLPETTDETASTFDTTSVTRTEPTLPPNKATLTLDYLGTGSNPHKSPDTPDLTSSSVGKLVWFGIGIKNPENLEYFTDGLYSVDFAIDYDENIFVPCDNQIRTSENINFDLTSTIKNVNINSEVDQNDTAYWSNASLYEPSLMTDLDTDTSDKYKTEFVTLKSTDGTDLRLITTADTTNTGSTVYLLRVPFKLVNMPDSDYVGQPVTISLTPHTFVLGGTSNGVTNSASWEGTVDRTTSVNNAKNHFDGVNIVDIFNTDGKYNIMGKVSCYDPTEPVTALVYKVSETGTETTPMYTFISSDKDDGGNSLYGSLTQTGTKGECEWEFSLPVSNLFSYEVVFEKQSHLTYPKQSVTKGSGDVTLSETLEMIVGDINGDEIIKLPDRAELMRFFNRQKPWELDVARFNADDLNGDGKVNLFDLELLKSNMGKTYAAAESTNGTDSADGTAEN